jgi:signal transduction histidine kinase/DNA-binding NarL/FixJ family response regulator
MRRLALPRLRPSPRLLIGLALLATALGVLWSAIWLHLHQVRRHELEAARRDGQTMARGLEQNIIRTIEGADQLLRYLQLGYKQDPKGFDLFTWAALRPHDALSVQLALIDRNGVMIASSLQQRPSPVDLSDREHFRVHRDSGKDRLFISKPVLGRVSPRWTIQLTRPVLNAAGEFEGVLVLAMDSDYLSRFYDSLRLRSSTIRLVGTDGVTRARAPAREGAIGALVRPATLERLRSANEGQYEGEGRDGVPRLYTFRKVEGYPLYVIAALDFEEVFAGWRLDRTRALILGAVLSMMLCLVAALLLRQAGLLERNRRALRSTLDNMMQGVVMADAGGRVRVLNERARSLLELQGRGAELGASVGRVLEWLGQRTGRPGVQERRTTDGRAVETMLITLPDGGLLLTATDVTRQRAASEAEAAARAAAEAANRAKSDFLANMSHEIRTPLNGVLGMVQALQHSGLSSAQQAMCDTMMRSGDALLRVVNDILDYSKLEAGKVALEPTPTALAPLVRDVAGLLRGAAEAKGLSLEVSVQGRQPPAVLADPVRLRQIVLNLLSNAVKFTEDGTVRLTLACAGLPGDRAAVSISVRDEGVGIAPAALETLFQRFTQADGTSTRRHGGTGLGLAISRELAQLMGGDIEVRSTPGAGSEFTLRLVLDTCSLPADDVGGAALADGPARSLDILVAEDDEINQLVIASFLQPTGHRVQFAHDGEEAVAAAQAQRFDLILMDAMMPNLDGIGATAAIRAFEGKARHTPIIALTANAMTGDRERYLACGMDGYVSKPIDRAELFGTIETLLGERLFRPVDPPAPTPTMPEERAAEIDAELDAIFAGLKG